MSIDVRFDRAGFHHPAYGRMGRGKQAGLLYTLPDIFAKPGMLPVSAEIVSKDELPDLLEELEQTRPIKPKVVDEAQLERAQKAAADAPIKRGRRKPTASETE